MSAAIALIYNDWKDYFQEDIMKKKLFAGLLAALMLLPMLSACGSNNASEKGSEGKKQEATYVWKCALNSTEGDNCYDQAVLFAKKIQELTGGQVQVDLYGGASLGSTSEVLEGMSAGVADIICEALGVLAPFTELGNIDAMPYMYSGADHFMAVWSSDLGDEIKEAAGEASIVVPALSQLQRKWRPLMISKVSNSEYPIWRFT